MLCAIRTKTFFGVRIGCVRPDILRPISNGRCPERVADVPDDMGAEAKSSGLERVQLGQVRPTGINTRSFAELVCTLKTSGDKDDE